MIVGDGTKTSGVRIQSTPQPPAGTVTPGVEQEPVATAADLAQQLDPARSREVARLTSPRARRPSEGLRAPATGRSRAARTAALEQSKPVAMSTQPDAAKTTKTPTAAQLGEIRDAVKAGDYQKAIDLTVQYYGIDTANVHGKITYDAGLTSADATTNASREIRVGPSVFQGHSNGYIASTILHEVTHANQVKAHGWPTNSQQVMAYEAMGYQVGYENATKLGLSAAETTFYKTYLDSNRNGLSRANRALYDKGQYWGMSP